MFVHLYVQCMYVYVCVCVCVCFYGPGEVALGYAPDMQCCL